MSDYDVIIILGDRVRKLAKGQHERLDEGKRLAPTEEIDLREEVFRMTVSTEHENPRYPSWVTQGMQTRGWLALRLPVESGTVKMAPVTEPEPEDAPEPEETPEEPKKNRPTKRTRAKKDGD